MTIRITADEITRRSRDIVHDQKHIEGPMLPILHALQAEFGYVPDIAKQIIADELNLSRAEVHGVITFYPDFRDHQGGRHVLKICRAEACQSMGGDDLADKARRLLGVDFHQTTPDDSVTLEPVYCLGLCACAPAAMLDGEVYGRVDEHCLSDIFERLSR